MATRAIFIQMKQSGAIMTLAGAGTGAAVGGLPVAASIILAPEVLAKAFTNPKIVRLLTTGFKYNQKKQNGAGRTFRQIIAQMSKEGLITEDEKNRINEDKEDWLQIMENLPRKRKENYQTRGELKRSTKLCDKG